jgi:hypothetical protein
MAEIVAVAEAVKDALNAGTFSQPVTAERKYLPLFTLPDMKDLHVTVVPKGVTVSSLGRNRNQYDYQVDVAVQKKLADEGPSDVDPLMSLVEEVADFFRLKRLAGYPNAVWARTENAPVYDPEHLKELRQFTSLLTFTFRVGR